MVLSVYLPVPFDQDRINILTSNTAYYYYYHYAPKDIFISLPPTSFWVNIESYIYSTGIATDTFSGIVYKPNGYTAFISDLKFKVKLKYILIINYLITTLLFLFCINAHNYF